MRNDLSKNLLKRFNWMLSHPEFKKNPHKVLFHWCQWEFFKLFQYQPIISIHQHSKMKLKPGAKRGIHGLIYIFRENLEPTVNYAVEKYVSAGSFCYDIGANIGLWTLRMSEIVGDSGYVSAFEPTSRNIGHLQTNISFSNSEKNIIVIPFALGNKEGLSKIYIPLDPGSSSMAPETDNDQCEEILVKRLDDVWKEQGYPNVDFVKIDVEGAEPLVLEGASSFFQAVRPVVVCEVNSRKLSLMGRKANDIFDKFYSWGYESFVFNWDNQSIVTWNHDKDADVLFLPIEKDYVK